MCQQDTDDVFEREKSKGLGTWIDASEASGFLSCTGVVIPSVVYVDNDQRKIKRRKPEDAAALT